MDPMNVKQLADFLKAKLSAAEIALLLDVLSNHAALYDLAELLATHLDALWRDTHINLPKPGVWKQEPK